MTTVLTLPWIEKRERKKNNCYLSSNEKYSFVGFWCCVLWTFWMPSKSISGNFHRVERNWVKCTISGWIPHIYLFRTINQLLSKIKTVWTQRINCEISNDKKFQWNFSMVSQCIHWYTYWSVFDKLSPFIYSL